jgi:hypothetical protein
VALVPEKGAVLVRKLRADVLLRMPDRARILAAVSSTSSLARYVVQYDGIPSCCGGLPAATYFPT